MSAARTDPAENTGHHHRFCLLSRWDGNFRSFLQRILRPRGSHLVSGSSQTGSCSSAGIHHMLEMGWFHDKGRVVWCIRASSGRAKLDLARHPAIDCTMSFLIVCNAMVFAFEAQYLAENDRTLSLSLSLALSLSLSHHLSLSLSFFLSFSLYLSLPLSLSFSLTLCLSLSRSLPLSLFISLSFFFLRKLVEGVP